MLGIHVSTFFVSWKDSGLYPQLREKYEEIPFSLLLTDDLHVNQYNHIPKAIEYLPVIHLPMEYPHEVSEEEIHYLVNPIEL